MRMEVGGDIAALESKARNSDPLLWVGGAPTGIPGGVECRQPASRLPVLFAKPVRRGGQSARSEIAVPKLNRSKGVKLDNL
jgi:hypothetical protein